MGVFAWFCLSVWRPSWFFGFQNGSMIFFVIFGILDYKFLQIDVSHVIVFTSGSFLMILHIIMSAILDFWFPKWLNRKNIIFDILGYKYLQIDVSHDIVFTILIPFRFVTCRWRPFWKWPSPGVSPHFREGYGG